MPFFNMLNLESKITFILYSESYIVAKEDFTIKDLTEAYPSFWNYHKGDYEAFINLCLDSWCKGKEKEGVCYTVGTFDIDRSLIVNSDSNNIIS